jgi:hypothetical protein
MLVTMALLFGRSCLPGQILFSNDGPLGRLLSDCRQLPGAFLGVWQDLNFAGYREGGALPNLTYGLRLVLGPLLFSKFYAPLALVVLGLGAWCFFRRLRLAPLACLLGAMAAMLNSSFFSAACWGVASHAITVGMSFLASAALADSTSGRPWLRAALGGLAVGMGVAEGADIGALFSVYVAAFVIFQAFMSKDVLRKKLIRGGCRLGVVICFAALVAYQALTVLVETQISGVGGAAQDAITRQQRWDWATRWSLPKREALGLLVPGLFGYRVDTTNGGAYWGAAGRDPAWNLYFEYGQQGEPPKGVLRFTGGGNYMGMLVGLIAIWSVCQALRRKGSVFSADTRRWVWFWAGTAMLSLLLSFGRYAPFYSLLYALPYFSTIRNPAKFVHIVNWAAVILFAYGVNGLWVMFMAKERAKSTGVREQLKAWWSAAPAFDKRFAQTSLAVLVSAALAFLIYSSEREHLESYLQEVRFDATQAATIAAFSIAQVGGFVVLLALSLGLLLLVFSGYFSGARARWGGLVLGLFLVIDLGRADRPWIIYWDYATKYATNPIIDVLREHPFEQRVALMPFRAAAQDGLLEEVYRQNWAQHQFQRYNIQSLDVVQLPRVPEDMVAFDKALRFEWNSKTVHRLPLRWQLTNTRYLLGAAALLDVLNKEIDPIQKRFVIRERFDLRPRSETVDPTKLQNLTAAPSTNGQYALFEFKGALPRARLYSTWHLQSDDNETLSGFANGSFAPETSVQVAGPAPSPGTGDNHEIGSAEFLSYAPKDISLKCEAPNASVLLLNDRFDPHWTVSVDGAPTTLLRCNYLMSGVYLAKGSHLVEFRFRPATAPLYVSVGAIGLGLLLVGGLWMFSGRQTTPGGVLSQTPVPVGSG